MIEWFQIWAEVPYMGNQFAGWLYTERWKVQMMITGLQTCPQAKFKVYDTQGREVGSYQFPGWTIPTF